MRGVLLISLFFLIYSYSPAQVEAGEFFFSFSGQRINKPDTAFVTVVVDIEDRHHFSVKRTEKYTGYPVTESETYRLYGDSLIRCENKQIDYYYRRIGPSLYDVRILKDSVLIGDGRAVSILPLIKEGIWYVREKANGPVVREEFYMNNAYVGNQRYGKKGEKLLASVFENGQRMPEYQGDLKQIEEFVNTLIAKSDCYKDHQLDGIIYGSFVVTETGEMTEYTIENSINECLDEIAWYALKQLPSRWKPGTIEGRNVRMIVRIPIRF
jgi:hypothetical protein